LDKDEELEKLRYEINVLRDTVSTLTKTIDDLKSTVSKDDVSGTDQNPGNDYRIFQDSESCLSQDASWIRLMNLLQDTRSGLTAAEAAIRWGKSRSRTSEVLNKLVDEGHLVKYRDGRRIKFRTLEE
jgi:Fic family protein